ncbi:Ankyrin repeat-containing protein [Spatholobus suberectus]|nr:Ankyrin repeat-containing protein [Spatholobus suberectus]
MMNVNTLEAAAQVGDIESLYRMIGQDPYVLEYVDAIPFVNTPLHIAAFEGQLQFAGEIMMLKPSFALKLNQEGVSPIHVALERGHNRIVLRLVDINNDLVRVQKKEGFTALHLASQLGNVDLLTKFLQACPNSIKDVTVKSETALHLAVRNQRRETLKFLVGWLETKSLKLQKTMLNWKDEDDNTILHIAVSNKDIEAIKLLIKYWSMDLDAKNLRGETALDIARNEEDIKRLLIKARARIRRVRRMEPLLKPLYDWLVRKAGMRAAMSEKARHASLVVATLVATATYQAALNPPGGYHQTNGGTNNTLSHVASNSSLITGSEGKSIMSNADFIALSTTNLCAFIASTMPIIGLLPNDVFCHLLRFSTVLLMASYFFSMEIISPNSLTGSVIVGSVYFFTLIFGLLVFLMKLVVH